MAKKDSVIKNCNIHTSGRTSHIWIREGSENIRIIDSSFIKEDESGEIEGCFLWIWALNGTIKNIYIGDENNMAKLCDAYLYDETQTAWVNVNTNEVLTE